MFNSFENISYSSATASIENNTDFSISGSSKKITFVAVDDELSISFDKIDLTGYEEISIQLYTTPNTGDIEEVFMVTIGSDEYEFGQKNSNNYFQHMLFDCSGYSDLDEIVITAKNTALVMFIDVLGYRKVGFDMDVDVIEALGAHISLDFEESTTITKSLSPGDRIIKVADKRYMNEDTQLLIGSETLELKSKDLDLKSPVAGTYATSTAISIKVPVKWGNYKKIDNDPVCGIVIYDKENKPIPVDEKISGGNARKIYLGDIFITIYVECSSDYKLHQLARQYEFKYGEQFVFLLDGQEVNIISIDSGIYTPDLIENKPRASYRYKVKPQPYTKSKRTKITTLTLTMESGSQ